MLLVKICFAGNKRSNINGKKLECVFSSIVYIYSLKTNLIGMQNKLFIHIMFPLVWRQAEIGLPIKKQSFSLYHLSTFTETFFSLFITIISNCLSETSTLKCRLHIYALFSHQGDRAIEESPQHALSLSCAATTLQVGAAMWGGGACSGRCSARTIAEASAKTWLVPSV
jgi:hypothetical protein